MRRNERTLRSINRPSNPSRPNGSRRACFYRPSPMPRVLSSPTKISRWRPSVFRKGSTYPLMKRNVSFRNKKKPWMVFVLDFEKIGHWIESYRKPLSPLNMHDAGNTRLTSVRRSSLFGGALRSLGGVSFHHLLVKEHCPYAGTYRCRADQSRREGLRYLFPPFKGPHHFHRDSY